MKTDKNKNTIPSEIIDYYLCSRGVGHTNTMLNGAIDTGAIIVVSDNKQKMLMKKFAPKNKIITLDDFFKVKGDYTKPLAFDNAAIYDLIVMMQNRINQLEEKELGE